MSTDWKEDLWNDHLHKLMKTAEERLMIKSAAVMENGTTNGLQSPTDYDPGKRLVATPYVVVEDGVAQTLPISRTRNVSLASSNEIVRHVEDPMMAKARAKKKKHVNAGPSWYHLPRTDLTPAMKRDLQLLQMRNVLDSHRHYRKTDDAGRYPEFSQPGTIIEGPTEFYSGRIRTRDRKQTLAEEILATEKSDQKFKTRYGKVQAKTTSGKKSHYKARVARHSGRRPR